MIIGIDFDNTIVCYDQLFKEEALRREIISPDLPARKEAVRDHLRRIGKEDQWTELQGYVYGPGITGAKPYEGLLNWLSCCKHKGLTVRIISHKTQFPYKGPKYDLHQYARKWLNDYGLLDTASTGLCDENVLFALTKEEKLRLISDTQCDFFIDDLPEFLSEPLFPVTTKRILFDPNNVYQDHSAWQRVNSWAEIMGVIEPVTISG